jgi:Icc protein
MKVAHLSDLHICTAPDTIIYGVNPYEHLKRAVSVLKERHDIDLGIITGDISNDGSKRSYEIADEILSGLSFPIFVLNGNHDNADVLLMEHYSKMEYAPSFTFDGVQFISLNTVAISEDGTNRSRGVLSENEFARLADSIANCTMPIVVLMHHPATLTGSWMDRRILENRERFIDCVTSSDKVIAVLSGHNHYATYEQIKGCLFSTAPSVGTSFGICLKPFEEANTPGISIISFEANSKSSVDNWRI